MRRSETESTIVNFVSLIGLEVAYTDLPDDTFLPGLYIQDGRILIDPLRLKHPGDLLHEAGHLAVIPSIVRSTLTGEVNVPSTQMEPIEAQAMAWSYAAALYLKIDPAVVFHSEGYHGRSEAILQSFSYGVYIGVQGLERAGLTLTPATAARTRQEAYPKMIKWVCD